MDNTELIKEIRLRWGKLYEDVRQNKMTTTEYAKRRRVYENMIWELEKTNEIDIITDFSNMIIKEFNLKSND
jgi:hypothetical protein